jgi:hypothetical protein
MDTQKKIKILLLICTGGLLISLTYIAYLFKTDGQMVFPKPAIGSFIRKPGLVSEGNIQKITWTIPEKCDYNSYEVREEGYVPNTGMLWGGGDVSCMQTDAGFQCQTDLHPEMKRDGRHWIIQGYGYGCVGKHPYISQPVTETY